MEFSHIPVLLQPCLDGLNIDPAGIYLDGTAGGAGHSKQIAIRLDPEKGGRLISLDQDPDAVETVIIELHKGKIMAKNDGEYIEFAIELNNNRD